ncbi:hypothetical protein [Streptomyces genisteinicus]|uniref:DUF2550 family protein n=1 Tax=Streptomyces genisteinicus TaxID=2768068 RepID=A0A7H0I0Q3_9ACTN|nr:hypothetical protein [Streptomyces genisteinicus]QNP66369.1 hypothetical protein IAG43_27870 [Streptomyces genisteinicus]
MTELVLTAVVLALAVWMLSKQLRQRSAGVAVTTPTGVPCMLKAPGRRGGFRPGRLAVGAGPLVWKPSLGGRDVALPADLAHTATRPAGPEEAKGVSPRARIVECASADGTWLIAVLPEELEHVIGAVRPATAA